MVAERKSVTVVVGAGASYDVWDERSSRMHERWRPPLTRELFNFKVRSEFSEFSEYYPGTVVLARELAYLAEAGSEPLEAKLREYASHRSPDIRRWYKDIPPYLCDIIGTASRSYVRVPSNYVDLFRKLIYDTGHSVEIIVLNYDTLVEAALNRFGYKFNDLEAYVGDRSARVYKIHGSVDWFYRMGAQGEGWGTLVSKFSYDWPNLAITIHRSNSRVRDIVIDDGMYYPVMTAPLAGKDSNSLVCPKEHTEILCDRLKQCRKFIAIGTSGLDEDLIEILHKSLGHLEGAHLVGAGDVHVVKGRFMSKIPQFGNAGGISVFSHGFSRYLESREFRDFLSV